MKISRVVIKNFRTFRALDVKLNEQVSYIIGENNVGKSAIVRAIQLCLDVSLPSMHRSLIREDINSAIDISSPNQVLVGVELVDFEDKLNEEALVSTWKMGPDRARIFYRFRPKPSVREQLESGALAAGDLTIEDYAWELRGGGDPAADLASIEWNDEGVGEAVRFSDLQSFLMITMPALRDVENDLRNARLSPLIKLIEASNIDEDEQNALIAILDKANSDIEQSPSVAAIANAIDGRFKAVSGPAFEMDATLGLSAATFRGILRNLKVLLSDLSLSSFEPGRNGLGMNNILYVSILFEYLIRRVEAAKSSGQLLVIEEPEAHLHPQLQAALVNALEALGVQVIVTTHSTQITSQAKLSSMVVLSKQENGAISASSVSENVALDADAVADLERYLDSTKSNLLFARKVMLVEGPAELFLIPALINEVWGVNLERAGISIIAIHGVHFDVYTRLFRMGCLEKKCAIVADADLSPSDASEEFDPVVHAPNLMALEGDFVRVFLGATTFERELVSIETLPMLIETARSLGAPNITTKLEAGLAALQADEFEEDEREELLESLGSAVLNTAKRFGKARFAQVAARYASLCTEVPDYIQQAYDWLDE